MCLMPDVYIFFPKIGVKIIRNIYRNVKQSNKKLKIRFLAAPVFTFLLMLFFKGKFCANFKRNFGFLKTLCCLRNRKHAPCFNQALV